MELRHLRYFLAIAEFSNYRAAAEKLLVSQPTLSQQMKDLEKELGAKLFERTGRGVRLTQPGKLFVEYAHRSLNILEEGQAAILEFDNVLKGSLRVGVLQTVGTYLIPQVVVQYSNQFPNIKLKVEELSAREIENRLTEGGLDIGISFEASGRSDLCTEPLFDEKLMLLVSPEHPLGRRKTVRCAEISKHQLCLLSQRYNTRKMIDSAFADAEVQLNVAVELNTVASCAAVALAGGPATILPEIATRNQHSGVCVQVERPAIKRTICLLNRKTQSPIRAQTKFAETVIAEVKRNRQHKL